MTPTIICANGHYYNTDHNPNGCPYCKQNGASNQVTVPTPNPAPVRSTPVGPTVPMPQEEGVTQRFFEVAMNGMDPVVGWVVCVRGVNKGLAFPLHSDFNFVGSAPSNDVVLNDAGISHERHFSICYDRMDNSFTLSIQQGRTILRCNGKRVENSVELTYGDAISVENMILIFVPLCTDKFNWDMYTD